MKLFLLSMLLTTQTICHSGYHDPANTVCRNGVYKCTTYRADNDLFMNFWNRSYSFMSRQSVIAFLCEVSNNADSTVLFDRRKFFIRSNREEYVLLRPWRMTSREYVFFKDTFSVPAGATVKIPLFQFATKNKMSYKEYKQLIASDTVSFEYSHGNRTDTIFRLYGIPRDEIKNDERMLY
jgi:hypothetical protein